VLRILEGIYRSRVVELMEVPNDMCDGARVLVIYLKPQDTNLRAHGIDEAHAAELSGRLATFIEAWDSPEMVVYDDSDTAMTHLQTR
jgi:hypothetical protein